MDGASKPTGDKAADAVEDRRAYIRVVVDCPTTYRVAGSVPPAKTAAFAIPPFPQIDAGEGLFRSDEIEDRRLTELFLWLDWRINFLVKTVLRPQTRELYPHQAIIVDLSATGMRIVTEQAHAIGRRLEFEMVLPITPFRELQLAGEVIRADRVTSGPDAGRYQIGVDFRDLIEVDRDQIIRYVLRRQMQIERERHNAQP